MEIYNTKIQDMLQRRGADLKLVMHPERGATVKVPLAPAIACRATLYSAGGKGRQPVNCTLHFTALGLWLADNRV